MNNNRAQERHCDICNAAEPAEEVKETYLAQDFEKVPLPEGLPKSQF